MDLDKLQDEHAEWLHKNFPGQEHIDPLLGLVEEVGELSHAILKEKQGIRGYDDPRKTIPEVCDAVGDIVIYLASFCTTYGISLDQSVQGAWDEVQQRDWQASPTTGGQDAAG